MSKIKERYAIVGTSAYKIETHVKGGEIVKHSVIANYPAGITKLTLNPKDAVNLIADMHSHAVEKIEYEAQVLKNKANYKSVQKRAG